MSATFIPYFFLLVLGYILVMVVNSIFNLIWTLLMSSYSLSLPAILWGGGAFNFPTFVPSGPSSPMNFYYWFFVIAVIVIVVAFAVNAFRQLTVWGKFDETQSYEGTNFWHQFKWVLILVFMTFLTPIIIWVCYSLLMLGVYFLMTLIGNNTMFLNIDKDTWDTLKQNYLDDLNAIATLDWESSDVYKVVLDAYNKGVNYWVTYFGDTQTGYQFYENLKSLIDDPSGSAAMGAFAQIKDLCAEMHENLQDITFDNPVTSPVLNGYISSLSTELYKTVLSTRTISIGTDQTIVVSTNSFFFAFQQLFAQTSGNTSFKSIIDALYGSSIPDYAQKALTQWQSGSDVFAIIGYGPYLSGQAMALENYYCSLYHIIGTQNYTIGNNIYDYYYLTFQNGFEVGLKTCPLIAYVNAMIGESGASQASVWLNTQFAEMVAAMGLCIAGDILKNQSVMGTSVPFAIAGWALIATSLLLLISQGIPLIAKIVVFLFGVKILIKPLFGMLVFLWTSFFEAMWYFFMLLPAIGAQVADSGRQVYLTTWKHCLAKMSATLLLWAGFLVMFCALQQVNAVFSMIWGGVKELSGDWSGAIDIDIPVSFGDALSGFQGLSIWLHIDLQAVIKFILAAVILNATVEFSSKLGVFAFGDAMGNMAQKIGDPIGTLAPGLAASIGAIGGRLKGLGKAGLNAAGKATGAGMAKIKKNATARVKKAQETTGKLKDNKKEMAKVQEAKKDIAKQLADPNISADKKQQLQAAQKNLTAREAQLGKENAALQQDLQKQFGDSYKLRHFDVKDSSGTSAASQINTNALNENVYSAGMSARNKRAIVNTLNKNAQDTAVGNAHATLDATKFMDKRISQQADSIRSDFQAGNIESGVSQLSNYQERSRLNAEAKADARQEIFDNARHGRLSKAEKATNAGTHSDDTNAFVNKEQQKIAKDLRKAVKKQQEE